MEALLEIVQRLRDPRSGCPWDLEQTHQSLRSSLLEECYETLDALEGDSQDDLIEELGDLLYQVIFHAQIAADAGRFSIHDVIERLSEKLVRRHPHVFGEPFEPTTEEVLGQWESVKAAERKTTGSPERSMLAGVPRSMPALAYSGAVIERTRRSGLDWGDWRETLITLSAKLGEASRQPAEKLTEEEFGDLLFRLVVAGRGIGMDPEASLRTVNVHFAERFKKMEDELRARQENLSEISNIDQERLWRNIG